MAAGVGMFVLAIAAAIVIAVAFSVSAVAGVVAAVVAALLFMVSFAAREAAARLLTLALYRFATAGAEIGGFTSEELSGAVRRKRRWRPWRD